MKQQLRKSVISLALSTKTGARIALRCAEDERFLSRLLEDPVFTERILGVPYLKKRLIEALTKGPLLASLLEDELFQSVAVDPFLDSEEFVSRISSHKSALRDILRRKESLRVLRGDDDLVDAILDLPEVLERLLDRDAILTKLLESDVVLEVFQKHPSLLRRFVSNEQTAERILQNQDLFESLFRQWPTVERLSSDSSFLVMLLSKPRVLETLLEDDSLISSLITEPRAMANLRENTLVMTRLFGTPDAFDVILNDEVLLTKFLSDRRVLDKLVSDDILLTKFLSQPRSFEKLVTDDQLCTRFIYHSRANGRILADPRLLSRLLNDPKSLELIVSDDALLTKFVSHGRTFEKVLADPVLMNRLLTSDRAIDGVMLNDSALNRLRPRMANDPGVLALIGNDKENLGKLLGDKDVCERLVDTDRFRDWVMNDRLGRVQSLIAFEEARQRVEPFVDEIALGNPVRLDAARSSLNNLDDVPNAVLDLVCDGDEVLLRNGSMRFLDRESLWVTLHEILVNEEYYFETDNRAPRILDCGAHFGLATYYWKSLYPEARITSFEPVDFLCKLAQENVKKNNFSATEVLPFALSDTQGKETFYISREDSMAGSLTSRRKDAGDGVSELSVECRLLSEYLDEPVHFLKLDIEGSEDRVLREAESKLENVQHIFCEYHHGHGLATNRLAEILTLLDQKGFDVHVAKSSEYQKLTSERAMTYADRAYSAVLFAKNRNWSRYR